MYIRHKQQYMCKNTQDVKEYLTSTVLEFLE